MSVSILVVDDEPDVADLFRQRFRREAPTSCSWSQLACPLNSTHSRLTPVAMSAARWEQPMTRPIPPVG
jgi:hypothetical protein